MIGTAAVGALVVLTASRGHGTAVPEQIAAPAPAKNFRYMGASTCSSAACHKREGPIGAKYCEYSTFMSEDKHAQAYLVLFNERSKIIEKNLKGLADLKDARPERNSLCLKCHAIDLPEATPNRDAILVDGVTCERCHGPAEKWLTRHYLPEWSGRGQADKGAAGFWPTKDLTFRAELCITCHVGSPDADVNHDLYAAGHPPLKFELGNFLARMPSHWDPLADRERYPDYEARVWFTGQVMCAKTALQLLEHRATSPNNPWPEYAEHDCFACHHDLREPSWRQKRGYGDRLPGSFPFNEWYYLSLPFAINTDLAALAEISKEMGKPNPDRQRVAQQARAAAEQLHPKVASVLAGSYDNPRELRKLLSRLVWENPEQAQADWDHAAQRYLALVAIYQATAELDPGQRRPWLKNALGTMRRQLEFPRGLDSPRDFDAAEFGRQLRTVRLMLPIPR